MKYIAALIMVGFLLTAFSPVLAAEGEASLSAGEGLFPLRETAREDASTRTVLLIITPQEFVTALQPLKAHKDYTDMHCEIVTLETIQESYAGRDLPEKVKYAIYDYRQQTSVAYVMLVGDSDKFPVRYVKAYNTEWGSKYYPSDLYYADIYDAQWNFDDWDGNGNNVFGEMDFAGFSEQNLAKLNLDGIDMYPDVAVGRVPASNAAEVTTYVNKVISYEFSAYNAAWSKKALWMVDNDWKGDSFKDRLDGYLTPSGFTIIKRYYDDYSSWTNQQRTNEIVNILNNGVAFANYGGHGKQLGWQSWLDSGISVAALDSLANQNTLPVVIAYACGTGDFDFNGCGCAGCVPRDYYWSKAGSEWLYDACGVQTTSRPEPAAIQPSKYDIDSLSEQFTVKRATGGIAYIGSTEVAEHGGEDLDKYFYEGYQYSWKPAALGGVWNYAMCEWLDTVPLYSYYAYIHMHKMVLFGDPSLRIGGISRIQLDDFAGTYRMDHNGWKGTLTLEANPYGYIGNEPNLVGTYTGDDGLSYDAHAYVRTWLYPMPDSWGPDNKIELHIEFAQHSVFEGYIFGTKGTIAGRTSWNNIPYGWYAVKGASAGDAGGSSTAATYKDAFAGTWIMDHDGWKGTLTLWTVPDDPIEQLPNIRGTYVSESGQQYDAYGYVRTSTYPIDPSWGPDHQIELSIAFAEEQEFEGFIWTGTKNTIAGVTWWHTRPFGWYALRAQKGDLNANGMIDWGDVVKCAYMSWNLITPDVAKADFNGNGFVDWGDVVKLAYYYWGKISSL